MRKRETKISVRTPGDLYKLISNRAYDLGLHHREYFLSLAAADLKLLELENSGDILSPEVIKEAKALLKKMDDEKEERVGE